METIIIKDNTTLNKKTFLNIFELYKYISEQYIFPNLEFKSIDDLSKSELKEFIKAKKDNSNLINI